MFGFLRKRPEAMPDLSRLQVDTDGRSRGAEFAIDLLRRLPAGRDLVVSPVSLRILLAMALEGARGRTAEELLTVLALPHREEPRAAALERMRPWGCAVANGLWLQRGRPLESGFEEALRTRHQATLGEADFVANPDAVGREIAEWVARATNGFVSPPDLEFSERTRMVLLNCIHFTERWKDPFLPERTRNEPFHTADGRTPEVPLMRQVLDTSYFRGKGFQGVDLGYQDAPVRMRILLPDRPDGLPELENRLNPAMLIGSDPSFDAFEVDLRLPRFQIEWDSGDLGGLLRDMGIRDAFDPERADFSGMRGDPPGSSEALHVSGVVQKARIVVDEKGTEAAAATGARFTALGMVEGRKRVEFHADRPFLYALVGGQGKILFLGRYLGPS